MKLTSLQKQRLRALAHKLKPTVIIGNQGLTDAVLLEVERSLTAHELIKVRVNAETREDRQEIAKAICQASAANLIQTIGHIVVIYRKQEKSTN